MHTQSIKKKRLNTHLQSTQELIHIPQHAHLPERSSTNPHTLRKAMRRTKKDQQNKVITNLKTMPQCL